MFRQAIVFLALFGLSLSRADDHDVMSPHFVLDRHLAGSTDVVMAASATTTQGPFFETESDYASTSDMTANAKAGSPGVTSDRTSVLKGIPFNLTLTFYSVTSSGVVGGPLSGAEIFLWHADTKGVYSAVTSGMQSENTSGQKWLRSTQTTSTTGSVSFQTILPGWYQGRAIHWHVRVKLSGATTYVATTQVFISDTFLDSYRSVSPYSANSNSVTYLANDNVYSTLSSAVASKLALGPVGSIVGGYKASINFGIVGSSTPSGTPAPTTKPTFKPTLKPTRRPTRKPTRRTRAPASGRNLI